MTVHYTRLQPLVLLQEEKLFLIFNVYPSQIVINNYVLNSLSIGQALNI